MVVMRPLRFFRPAPSVRAADLDLLREHLTHAGRLDASAPLQLSQSQRDQLTRAGLLRRDDPLAWPSPQAAQQLGLQAGARTLVLRRCGEAELLARWTVRADDPRPHDVLTGWRWRGAGLGLGGTLSEQLGAPARLWKDGAARAAHLRGADTEEAWAEIRALRTEVEALYTPEWLRRELREHLMQGVRPVRAEGRA